MWLSFAIYYEIPVTALNESGTKSDIKGYHAYVKSWKAIIGENFQTRPESENIVDKYAAPVLKDTQGVGHLTNGKSGQYTKTIFYFLWSNQSNSAVATVKGKRTSYEMDKDKV